eukprot:CAMPEP_0194558246 /NCGR_PEP_ID=MMETSP0292-20121207/232_1 /TAXON_ID=39354 /ORGANISM="Heterosigma akashiwo, Strain CCMP2393" /LENGTH=257 /DNA_ID=CAMNT_0039405845 /DNA_START=258 /DNA_END=1028 /DNA_ORIENTATION=-
MGAVPSTEGGIPEIIHEEGALEMNEEDYTPENIVPEVCPEKEPRLKAPRTEVPGKKEECNQLIDLFGTAESSIKVKACLLKAQSRHSSRQRFPSRPHPDLQGRKRSVSEEDVWGWFEEVGETESDRNDGEPIGRANSFTGGYKETPDYVIEESKSSQALWHNTAGKRPQQPEEEREYFKQLWDENFKHSEVNYSEFDLHHQEGGDLRHGAGGSAGGVQELYKGTSPYTSAVAKAFRCRDCGTTAQIIIHIPKYRVVR